MFSLNKRRRIRKKIENTINKEYLNDIHSSISLNEFKSQINNKKDSFHIRPVPCIEKYEHEIISREDEFSSTLKLYIRFCKRFHNSKIPARIIVSFLKSP